MQVKKTFKENKEIVKQGFEAPKMANPNKNQSPMKETNI